MKLVRHTPHKNAALCHGNLAQVFDGFFDDFFGPTFYQPQTPSRAAVTGLHVDIFEKDNIIVLEAELPGIAKEDITIDVKGKQLTLGAERKNSEEVNSGQCYRQERRYGRVERSFALPFEIAAEKVEAKYENGILRLEIPKPEETQSKQIEIK